LPSEKILQQKQEYVKELSGKLKDAVAGVVVSYQGLTVADDTQLRRELRAAGVEYAVIKNTMLSRAAAAAGLEGLDNVLKGTTALALSSDHVAAAKILSGFAEKNKALEIKAGFVEGKVIDVGEVKELAKMPPKEVLVAKALGGLNAPISGFVCVLNANLRGLAVALNAIAEKQGA
jgi:large subunit ribosomal protein L10